MIPSQTFALLGETNQIFHFFLSLHCCYGYHIKLYVPVTKFWIRYTYPKHCTLHILLINQVHLCLLFAYICKQHEMVPIYKAHSQVYQIYLCSIFRYCNVIRGTRFQSEKIKRSQVITLWLNSIYLTISSIDFLANISICDLVIFICIFMMMMMMIMLCTLSEKPTSKLSVNWMHLIEWVWCSVGLDVVLMRIKFELM